MNEAQNSDLPIAERVPTEDVVDIPDGENLEPKYGPRFKGWYMFKDFIRKETSPTGWPGVNYEFDLCRFEFIFIMPPRIEFAGGAISYGLGDRELGVFRFPRSKDGDFTTPLTLSKEKIMETVGAMTEDDVAALLKAPAPLVFNAFKIPRYRFEYFDLSDSDVQNLERITPITHVAKLKEDYDVAVSKLLKTVTDQIESGCNYLSILQNVLDRNWRELTDLSAATGDIIHI